MTTPAGGRGAERHPFHLLGDPVRRRVLELLAGGERTSGEITTVIRAAFGISQPAVSQQLRALREGGLVSVRPDGPRRIYTLDPAPLREVDEWLQHFRGFWEPRLDALATEVARGKRERRMSDPDLSAAPPPARGGPGAQGAPGPGGSGRKRRPGAA